MPTMPSVRNRETMGPSSTFRSWLADVCSRLERIVSPPQSVAANLALDEALARSAAIDGRALLRLWWGGEPTVVLGYSERPERVADLSMCRRLGIGVIPRVTGGGAVLQTAGVLNYSLTAPAPQTFDLGAVFALGAHLLVGTLASLGVSASARGTSDVAVGDRKISGNAMARRWGGLLLHGTLLCDLDLELVEACLRHPPREPDYRRGRSHRDFLTSLRTLGVVATPGEVEAAFLDAARELTEHGWTAYLSSPTSESKENELCSAVSC